MGQILIPGTATPAHVLAGDTFSAGPNYIAPGTMPEQAQLTVNPTNAAQNFGAGHYTGITVNPSAGVIKRKQSGRFTWTTTEASINVAISAVDLTKAIVLIKFSNNQAASTGALEAELANATTVTISRWSGAALGPSDYVYWEVIEFNNVKTLQTGATPGSGVGVESQIVVSSVDPNKCMLFTNSKDSSGSSGGVGYITSNRVIDATHIGITASSTSVVYWQLIEFN